MKYFNEENKYEKPMFIKFDTPKVVKLCDLREFLEEYRPFPCADVYLYERFEYGDFDNWVSAIVESTTIDPTFSKVYREEMGIFKEGETKWSVCTKFWHYSESEPFWEKCPQTGYSSKTYKSKSIDEIEIEVEGVYVIAWYDKDDIRRKYEENRK